MGLVITFTLGICLWLVLWATGAKGDDAGMLALAIVVIVVCVKIAASHLSAKQA